MRRSPWFWLGVILVGSTVVLTVSTISANRLNQSVEWYAGVGQWLGALGSLLAAGMALWIVTTDRRRFDQLRQDEQRERDADLLREAGLVRLMDLRNTRDMNLDDLSGRSDSGVVGIKVRNYRADRIFDLDLSVDTAEAQTVDPMWTYAYPDGYEKSQVEPEKCTVAPDGELYLQARLRSWIEHVRITVRYTDQRGRRWQIDADGNVARVPLSES